VKLKLDLHDIYNQGDEIEKALKRVFDEAAAKKAPLVEIIPGKGSGQLKKHVIRFLEKNRPPAKHYRLEKDSKNFGRVFVHLRWLPVHRRACPPGQCGIRHLTRVSAMAPRRSCGCVPIGATMRLGAPTMECA
jgi:hypothetical protein